VISNQWSVAGEQLLVKGEWGQWLGVGVITAAALLIRLVGLGAQSYWFDEAREVLRVLTPWPDILLVSEGADPPLYRLLLFPIGQLTTDEFWLRLPSAVFSTASVFLAYVWLRQLGRPELGVVTAALLALAPVQILYAQEVSQYSLTVFLALLILMAFEGAAQHGRPGDWLLLTAVSLTAMYTYYGLAWLLPILDLDLAWRTWQQRSRQRLAGFIGFHMAVAAGLVILYGLFLAEQFNRFSTNKALAPALTDMAVLRDLDNQLLNGFVRFFTIPFAPDAPDLIVWFFVTLFVIGLFILWRQGLGRLVVVMVTAVLTLYLAFGLGLYPFGDRYALFLTPLFYAVIAAVLVGVWSWRGTAVTVVLSLPIFLIFLAFWPNIRLIPNPWLSPVSEELRPVVAHLQNQLQPEDFIYVYYGAVPAYRIYEGAPTNPTEYGIWFRNWPLEEKIADIQRAASDAPRLWLIMSHVLGGEDGELIGGLESRGYQVVAEYEREDARAVLFRRE
jgi:hypothetical protein